MHRSIGAVCVGQCYNGSRVEALNGVDLEDRMRFRSLFGVSALCALSIVVAGVTLAHAGNITVQLDNGLSNAVIDSSVTFTNIATLTANTYEIVPISFTDAVASFSGNAVIADIAGEYIYVWVSGTATGQAGSVGDYLNVTLDQSYVTQAGVGLTTYLLEGLSCDANATSSLAQINVTVSSELPNEVPFLNCSEAPTIQSGAGGNHFSAATFDILTTASFAFGNGPNGNPPGVYPGSITATWGVDAPDPSINFNDSNNPDNFVTLSDNPGGLQQIDFTPEPATWSLIGPSLGAIAFFLRRRKPA
jgi:hypothetical protein